MVIETHYTPVSSFLSCSLSLSVAVTALLLLPRPGETQEESVWPRWLLPADTAKVIQQHSPHPQSPGSY